MPLLTPDQVRFADTLAAINVANPFQPERVELERRALGEGYVEVGSAKALDPDARDNPNLAPLLERAEDLLATLHRKGARARPTAGDRQAALDVTLFVVYHRYFERLKSLARSCEELESAAPESSGRGPRRLKVTWYASFRSEVEAALTVGGERLHPTETAPRLLALFFQVARAFGHIFAQLAGRSPAAARLRAEIWQSTFTHDIERYRRSLVSSMVDVPTLVTGPSGTGKELVARAVGRSGHLAFEEVSASFTLDPRALFLAVHLSALPASLIESELFGHRRGAFTGALDDRAGWFEQCAPYGAVFLDELAEIEPTVQVKLLRVLQTRELQRVGDLAPRRFEGRLVSATNRDLEAEIEAGRFREDLYYRLCADRIHTPALSELIGGDRGELDYLVRVAARGILRGGSGPDDEAAASLADGAAAWIESELGLDYPWPGNFRELEQCLRAFVVRGEYRPRAGSPAHDLAAAVRAGSLTADELLTRYCRHVHGQVGTFEGTARRLGLDRRTVRARVQSSES